MTLNISKFCSYCCVSLLLLWAASLQGQTSAFTIDNGTVAGTYDCATPVFSADFSGQSGELAFPNGPSGSTVGCATFGNDLTGKIALVTSGACPHAQHATNAQEAGAIAIVICNHIPNFEVAEDAPLTLIDDAEGAVTIPVLALDSTTCVDVILAMGTQTLSATFYGPGAGETCISAITATEGTNTVVMSTSGYGGTIYPDATHATWYNYTAPINGTLTISSCGAGVDTRLIGFTDGDCENILNDILTFSNYTSVDVCDDGLGNIVASEVSFGVGAGETFKFYWDNSSSSQDFDFTVNTVGVPVAATVSVDMSDETVDASGVFVNGNFTNGMPMAMTDDGNGVYSYAFTAEIPTTLSYSFYNGTTQEAVAGLTSCGDGTTRTYEQTMASDFDVPLVCFSSCDQCVIVDIFPVTFTVDLALEATPAIAYLDGSFSIGPEPMTLIADQRYALTKMLEAGQTYTYNFQNGVGNGEANVPVDCSTNGNREVTVGNMAMDLAEVCFDYCEDCQTVDVDEKILSKGIAIFPNPASQSVWVKHSFDSTVSLELTIFNGLGQLMLSDKITGSHGSQAIDIASLTPGIYLIHFTDGSAATTKRLVVQ